MKGLFINNSEAKDSIYLSGKMVFDCLRSCKNFALHYQEINSDNKEILLGYDFYFINYHPYTMAWLDTKSLRKKLGFVGTIVLEVLPGDPFVMCPEKDFDFYCVLDPTINIRNNKVFAFPRPLPFEPLSTKFIDSEVPVIGSFGFATKGKGFQHVVDAVNKEFDRAIIRINIPFGDFVPNSKEYAAFLEKICKERAKPGIKIQVTNNFMSEEELIMWCSENTINCFLYDRKMPGLSATTDQAIISGRPLAVSNNETFRHITQYIKPYPLWTLKQSITESIPGVIKMQNDWSPQNFANQFIELLNKSNKLLNKEGLRGSIVLSDRKYTFTDAIENKIKKYRRKLKLKNLKALINDSGDNKKII